MAIIYDQETQNQGRLRIHEIDGPDSYTGYILHARRASNVLYFALSKDDLVSLRDSINKAVGE